MDLGGADLRVGTIGLKLPIAEFPLGFDEGALLEGAGPFSELPPNHDPMPFGSRFVFAGVLFLPTHVGCEGKPSVGCPVGREASLCVFAEKPDERDAILAEHFVSPFRAPSVGATESEWVLLPRARDALLGETFRGNRQSRVAPSRRAQGFDPEAEPNGRGQESGTRNCETGITDQISKAGRIEARQCAGRAVGNVRSKRVEDCPANSGAWVAVELGEIV